MIAFINLSNPNNDKLLLLFYFLTNLLNSNIYPERAKKTWAASPLLVKFLNMGRREPHTIVTNPR